MGSLINQKRKSLSVPQEQGVSEPRRSLSVIPSSDPNAPTLSGRTQATLAGGITGDVTRGIEKDKIRKLKDAARAEFEKLLMRQEKGVDQFVQSSINRYGKGVVEYLPPKELFYDENGDFQPVEYYKHALVGIKEYIPIRSKEKERERAEVAQKEYIKQKGGEISPEQELAFAAEGLKGGLTQAEKEASLEQKQTEEAGRGERAQAGIVSRERIARLNNESRERIAAANRELKNKEKVKLVDPIKLDDKARVLRGEAIKLEKILDTIDDKDSELYIETKELLKASKTAAKQYKIAAEQAKLRPRSEEDLGGLLSEAGQQAEVETAQNLIDRYNRGEFRRKLQSRGRERDEFIKKFKEVTGVDIEVTGFEKAVNPLTTQRSLATESRSLIPPDKKTLAEKALADPNAPEEVKAKAREILGL